VRTILDRGEAQIMTLVRDYLEHAGFAVTAATARASRSPGRAGDAVVLDLGLPRSTASTFGRSAGTPPCRS
jgi:DNA-binding response OmpR family regulator